MAEILDDFSTNPFAGNWTNEINIADWDATDLELDLTNDGTDSLVRRSAGGPGGLEHEVQVTTTTASDAAIYGPMARVGDDGTDDGYAVNFTTTNVVFRRFNAGVLTALDVQSSGLTITNGRWYSICLVVTGGPAANAILAVRIVDHGTSKPSDPGWLDMTVPDATFTDTDASRLDDDTLHLHGGIGGSDIGGIAVVDTRHDYWKMRLLSDRVTQGDPHANFIPKALRPSLFAPGLAR